MVECQGSTASTQSFSCLAYRASMATCRLTPAAGGSYVRFASAGSYESSISTYPARRVSTASRNSHLHSAFVPQRLLQRTRKWSGGLNVVQLSLPTASYEVRPSGVILVLSRGIVVTSPHTQYLDIGFKGKRGTVVAAQRPYTAVMIVPTGTGASIGGFAGDSLPVARAMASVADCLITHPNVLNGAMLYWPMPNALYVEGYALDKFAEGSWGLQPVHQNRVGLVLDAGMEEEMKARHLQVADAACATLGLPMLEYIVTDMPLQVEKWVDLSGASTGRLGRPDSLMRAVNNLVKSGKVDAVAVVARFPDDSCEDLVDYRQGKGHGVDVLAGVEAIISHMVVQEFQIPCAHAPALALLPFDPTISPRSAAEEIGFTFLPCVLVGLSRAPQYVSKVDSLGKGTSATLWASDVDCVVVPFNACGGAGTLAFGKKTKHKPLILAVEENETVLNDTPEQLQLNAVRVANYWEALGVMAAHKAGVDPQTLRRNGVSHLRRSHTFSTKAEVIPRSKSVAR